MRSSGRPAVVGTDSDLLTDLYTAHFRSLVRLAAMLVDDVSVCEELVQEAYIRVYVARGRPSDPDKALAYLRQTVVNLARSSLRRRLLAARHAPKPMPDAPSAEEGAYDAIERDEVVRALRTL